MFFKNKVQNLDLNDNAVPPPSCINQIMIPCHYVGVDLGVDGLLTYY